MGRLVSRDDVRGYAFGASTKTFAPWRANFVRTFLLVVIGSASTAATVYVYLQTLSYLAFLIAGFAVICFFEAYSLFQIGHKRRRGKMVEQDAKQDLQQHLPNNWDVVPNGYIKYVGDIDVPLRLSNNELCVVEIKSLQGWKSWHYWDWHHWERYSKQVKAVVQVRRQRRVFDASYGVIWLPRAQNSFTEGDRGILVVGGKAEYLIQQITRMMWCFAVIRFPSQPSREILDLIKSLKFWYDPSRCLWEGHCSQHEAQYLRPLVEEGDGTLALSSYRPPIRRDRWRRFNRACF